MAFPLVRNRYFILALILLLYIVSYFALKPAYPNSDDYWYTYHSVKLFAGDFHLTANEFQNRIGLTAPVGILIKVLGVNPYSVSLFPLLCGLLMVCTVFLVTCKYSGVAIATITGTLIAANVLQITYSVSLFPDVVIASYITLIALFVFKGRTANSLFYPVAISSLLALSFLTKETIAILFPFLLIVFITDIIKKQHKPFWVKTIICSVIALLALLLLYYLLTGDPFFRFRTAFGFVANDMAYPSLVKNFTEQFHNNIALWFIGSLGYIFLFIFSLPILFTFRKINLSDFKQYIVFYTIILLVEYFIAILIPRYGLVFYQERIWMPLIAPLAILAAYFITEQKRKDMLIVFIIIAILTIASYFLFDLHRALLWGVFSVAIGIALFLKLPKQSKTFLLLSPFILLLCFFIYSNSNYRSGMEKVHSFDMHSHDN